VKTPSTPKSDGSDQGSDHDHELEEYAGGTIHARHGYLPVWLLVVYAVLFVWGLYYAYHYWGGVGPGRIG
jgi:hypothetical protein